MRPFIILSFLFCISCTSDKVIRNTRNDELFLQQHISNVVNNVAHPKIEIPQPQINQVVPIIQPLNINEQPEFPNHFYEIQPPAYNQINIPQPANIEIDLPPAYVGF